MSILPESHFYLIAVNIEEALISYVCLSTELVKVSRTRECLEVSYPDLISIIL